MEAESFSLHPYRFEGQWSAADKKFVAEVLVDPRGWAKQGRLCVPNDVAPDAPVEFTMRIASEEDIASMFPEGFRGLSVSVMNTRPREIYFNAKNWAAVPPASGYRSLKGYRTYLVNHEVGHAAFGLGHFWLGNGHNRCDSLGRCALLHRGCIGFFIRMCVISWWIRYAVQQHVERVYVVVSSSPSPVGVWSSNTSVCIVDEVG